MIVGLRVGLGSMLGMGPGVRRGLGRLVLRRVGVMGSLS